MSKVLTAAFLVVALVGLLASFNIYQFLMINSLKKSNAEYQLRLDNVNSDFNTIKQENEKLRSQFGSQVSDVTPNIVTRLGAKLFERGVRDVYGTISNYVWMTGEVQNTGNVSAFVSLSIKISTTKGFEIQEVILGTLQPDQIVPVASTIWPENGSIISWTITPSGYHFR